MNIKNKLAVFPLTKGLYAGLKKKRDDKRIRNKFAFHGEFIDRSKNKQYLCVILAGYKSYLYSSVFSRIQKYKMDDMDICVVTSGKFDQEINELCQKNDWSYLSTKENNVSLVQNVAISKHPNAQFIFKLDEDIFICESFFERMLQAYSHAQTGDYDPGVIAPLLLVNGFTSLQILRKIPGSI